LFLVVGFRPSVVVPERDCDCHTTVELDLPVPFDLYSMIESKALVIAV
jgi:hypothetical protein